MPAERFFINEQLKKGLKVELHDREFHHMARVMHIEPGETVEVVNGKGQLGNAQVVEVKKRYAALQIHDVHAEPKAAEKVVLAQAIPRSNRLDFILEKGTELGMTSIWLFPGDHSERKKLSVHQKERMHTIAIAAMKQCGRLYLPEIEIKPALRLWPPLSFHTLYGDPNGEPFKHVLQEIDFHKGIVFFIGPESGFSDEEHVVLEDLGAKGVKFNSNVLRTDTAALAALSIVMNWKEVV